MNTLIRQIILFIGLSSTLFCFSVQAQNRTPTRQDTIRRDTITSVNYNPFRPTFQPQDRYGDPFSNLPTYSPLYLKDPSSLKLDVQIDTGMNYTIYEKIGNVNFRPISSMSFDEFRAQQNRQMLKSYWQGEAKHWMARVP
ncbi:MAG: hypothetical protein HC811_06695 [Flammeovirgaceae bacterium]|nr:hypothetical protein [Flammeovirgaceae bacterium]